MVLYEDTAAMPVAAKPAAAMLAAAKPAAAMIAVAAVAAAATEGQGAAGTSPEARRPQILLEVCRQVCCIHLRLWCRRLRQQGAPMSLLEW